jgi:hypothetical protein
LLDYEFVFLLFILFILINHGTALFLIDLFFLLEGRDDVDGEVRNILIGYLLEISLGVGQGVKRFIDAWFLCDFPEVLKACSLLGFNKCVIFFEAFVNP